MKRLSPQRLFQHAVDTENWELAALLVTAGALEILCAPLIADQPAPTRAAFLQTLSLNLLQPAWARASS